MDESQINNSHFYRLLQAKDHEAFSDLYYHFSGAIFGEIMRIVKDQPAAEDLLQDSFVKIYQRLHLYDPLKGRLYTWMITIARNTCIDYYRRERNRQEKYKELPQTDIFYHNNQIFQRIEVEGVRKQLLKLGTTTRKIMELVYLHGYTHEETAKICLIPLGTLKTRIRITLKNLNRRLMEVTEICS